jgi:hypothetical protein
VPAPAPPYVLSAGDGSVGEINQVELEGAGSTTQDAGRGEAPSRAR